MANFNTESCGCGICEELQGLFINNTPIDVNTFVALIDETNGCSRTTLGNLLSSTLSTTDDQNCTDKKKIGSIDIAGTITEFFESVTGFDTPTVNSTDPNNVVVTIPYTNEECVVENVDFTIPIPNPASFINSIDLKFDNNGDLIIEAVYTDDQGNVSTITDTTPVTLPLNEDYVEYTENTTVPTGTPPLGVDTRVLSDGSRYDWDGTQWILASTPCPEPMTRRALIALRNAGGLSPQCHYIITNPSSNGALKLQKVLLHAVDEQTLSGCYLFTAHDNTAWNGSYDIDTDKVEFVHDHLRNNRITTNNSITTFPFSVSSAYNNEISNTPITYTSGTFYNNVIKNAQQLVIGGTNFAWNTVENAANVNVTGGSFTVNRVLADANIAVSTGNVSNNEFINDSSTNITGGSVLNNRIGSLSRLTVSLGTFRENTIENESTVTISGTGTIEENVITGRGTLTVKGGNFARNTVTSQARVTSSKNAYRNEFTSYCNVNNAGTGGSLEDSDIHNESILNITTSSNVHQLTMNGNSVLNISGNGQLYHTIISNNSQVTISSQSNYNNVIQGRSVYNQVGTGWLRYTTIDNQSSVSNGNTNIAQSHIDSYTGINTTGATGDLVRNNLSKATINAINCPAFFVRESEMTSLGSINANNSARVYFYRGNLNSYGRLDVRTGSRIDASCTTVSSYGYLQSTISGGFLTVNNTNVSGSSYVRNTTPNANTVSNCIVGGSSNMRFDGDASGGRIYYSSSLSGTSMYQTTGSVNCYFYYVNGSSAAQIYSQNAVNLRMYYSSASSYAYLRSINNPATHYMYYCNADARGYVQMFNNVGTSRMYAVTAQGQSVAELRGSTGNLYYSSFSAYFYGYITRTSGTSSGLFGMGRRSQTIANPVGVTPYASGSAWLNF